MYNDNEKAPGETAFAASCAQESACEKERAELLDLLARFEAGYAKRDWEHANEFARAFFTAKETAVALGTGTGELFVGTDEIASLIESDFRYWGDMRLSLNDAVIRVHERGAWVAVPGAVRYVYDSSERAMANLRRFVEGVLKDEMRAPLNRAALVNWALSLALHAREKDERVQWTPMHLSGVLVKEDGAWKFACMQFSMPGGDFPDERFEHTPAHKADFDKQNERAKSAGWPVPPEAEALLDDFGTGLFAQQGDLREPIGRLFAARGECAALGTESRLFSGHDGIASFFEAYGDCTLALSREHTLARRSGDLLWIVASGTLTRRMDAAALADRAAKELLRLRECDMNDARALLRAHALCSAVLMEASSGETFTWPVRLSAAASGSGGALRLELAHFSFPFYWIMEDKIAPAER